MATSAAAVGIEPDVVELFNWQGLFSAGSETEVGPQYVRDCQNVDFDYGLISKRRGTSHIWTFSGSINLLYDFQSQQGFSTLTDRVRTLVIGGGTLSVIQGWPTSLTFDATFAVSNQLHYGVTGKAGDCFLSNEGGGIPKLLAYISGTWRYFSAAFSAPATMPTMAVGSTALPSGEYRAVYTYQDLWGNETNPSPESATLSVTAQAVNVGVIGSSDPAATIINLYLKPPDASLYQFAMTASNTTGTISWTGSDATILEGEVAPSDNFPCPAGKYVAIYQNMLIVAGDPNVPDALWASHSNFLREFSSAPFFRAVSGDGQPVVGFGKSYGKLLAMKSDSQFIVTGSDDETIKADPYNEEKGVLGQPSIVSALQRAVYFSDDGVYADNTVTPKELSAPIRDKLRTLNPANLASRPPKQFMATYGYYKKVFASVREATGAGENDTLLVYDYERDGWTRWKDNAPRYIAAIQNPDDYEYLHGGNSAGHVFLYNPPNGASPNSDDLTGTISAIDAHFETPWLHLPKLKGYPDWPLRRTQPTYIGIYAGGEPAGSNNTISLVTEYRVDFLPTVQGTFSTTHAATAWPDRVIQPAIISNYGGHLGTYNWIKLKIRNAELDEHFYVERIVFGFQAKDPTR